MVKNLTKARILEHLECKLSLFLVPKLFYFTSKDFLERPKSLVRKAALFFEGEHVVVRSSASDEDGILSTLAGEYESVLDVPSLDSNAVSNAINSVIQSYDRKGVHESDNEILLQKMVLDVSMSGVIFTHDLNTGAPYYVINYDDQSGSTDTVTSGNGEYANRTLYIHRKSISRLRSERFQVLMKAVQELEAVMGSEFLDIEFALTKDLTPCLLQVRAITTSPNWSQSVAKQVDDMLQEARIIVRGHLIKRYPGVYGETTVLGQMPDWNPVEMIGRAPRALAMSLYQSLITDKAWKDARSIMGYAIPTELPLMLSIAGQPFIDTRLSFHSYLPREIHPNTAEKLVTHWVEQLKSMPELHDKIEFKVAITAYSFDIDEKIEVLIGDVLSNLEKQKFRQAHVRQFEKLLTTNNKGSINRAIEKIEILRDKQKEKLTLHTMFDDCLQYGTIPFAILARHGFIAQGLLLSLEKLGILSGEEVRQIQQGTRTIASDLVDDMNSLKKGDLSYVEFMQEYGHLRPGTYDIRSLRYDQMKGFSNNVNVPRPESQMDTFDFSLQQRRKINSMLSQEGFKGKALDADSLLNYIRNAIVGREYGKFVFTRSVSDMLELMAKFAKDNGLSRDEISHVPFSEILKIEKNSTNKNTEKHLRSISMENAKSHETSVAIRLPQLLIEQSGVYIIPFQVSHPNFITHKKVSAPLIVLRAETNKTSLNGKIVVIEGADPGFDWIFSQDIVGLITKYGGANSHMAIRCAEFGIPAAIGCGDQHFDRILKSSQVHIDCSVGLISTLN